MLMRLWIFILLFGLSTCIIYLSNGVYIGVEKEYRHQTGVAIVCLSLALMLQRGATPLVMLMAGSAIYPIGRRFFKWLRGIM